MKIIAIAAFLLGGWLLSPDAWADGAAGTLNPGAAGFIGIFYDLKQHADGQPRDPDYLRTISRFIDSGWNEHILDDCYRASQPIYTTMIMIPVMDANMGPSSFKIEDRVKPSNWIIHYKAQVVAPKAGTFRFVGLADDVMAAAINSKTVLIGSLGALPTHWKNPSPPTRPSPSGPLRNGDWFSVKQGEVLDLDVLISEFPGGSFDAFFMIEEQGVNYVDNKIPVFQTAHTDWDPTGGVPAHIMNAQIWKALP